MRSLNKKYQLIRNDCLFTKKDKTITIKIKCSELVARNYIIFVRKNVNVKNIPSQKKRYREHLERNIWGNGSGMVKKPT